MRPPKVLFLVPYAPDLSPGQRFRFEQWLSLLSPGSIDAHVRPLLDRSAYRRLYEPGGIPRKAFQVGNGLVHRLQDVSRRDGWDAVFIAREAFFVGPPLIERFLESRYPVVYDFDDAIYLQHASDANAFVARWKNPDKVARIVGGARMTTVGNEHLAAYARQFGSVSVIPTTIDVEQYTPLGRARGAPVRVGWSGSRTTSAHLHSIDTALRRIAAELPVELVVIGDPDYRLAGVPTVDVMPWRSETELDDLRSIDIGLMPLPDDDWTRGKCGLKALQYMALGIPTVVSPVGVNTEIVKHNENGLVAESSDAWFDAVARLVEDEALSRQLGDAGRETVTQSYSGQHWAPRFLDVLRTAISA